MTLERKDYDRSHWQ